MKQNEPNSFFIRTFFARNFNIIASITISSTLLAGMLTCLIKPEYSSSAIIFPPSSSSMEYTIENPNFGYDVEADRLLQIFQSTALRDSLSKKFNLVAYYSIDTSKIDWKDRLNDRLKRTVKFERTRFMSIEIVATTTDPLMSAAIVNYLLSRINSIRDDIYKVNIVSTVTILKQEYELQKSKSDSLAALISQKGKFTEGFLLKQDKDGKYNISINQPSDILLAQLINQYIFEQNQTNELYSKYGKAKNQLSMPVPAVYVVSKAAPSFKKVSPSYSKNIMIAFLGSFFICMVVLYVKQEIYSNLSAN